MHVVGGDEDNPQRIKLGLLPIYLERYDQKLRCYRGADKIVVEESSITVTLNNIGQDGLDLPEALHFVAEKPAEGYKAAKEIFLRMKQYESGSIIHVS